MKYKAMTVWVCMLLTVAGDPAMAFETLRHNPFEQPEMISGKSNVAGLKMKLRGTVIDGEDSLVNIDGAFYRVNQEFSGYRVMSIKRTSVTLQRGNSETVLTLENDE